MLLAHDTRPWEKWALAGLVLLVITRLYLFQDLYPDASFDPYSIGLIVWLGIVMGESPAHRLLLAGPVLRHERSVGVECDRIFAGTTLVLFDGALWFLGAEGPAQRVPVAQIQAVEPLGKRQVLVRLDGPHRTQLKLVRHHGGVDALAQLRRAVEGLPLFSSDSAADGPPPGQQRPQQPGQQAAADGLRCSLCGRPAVGSPSPGSVHICERCQNRARYEAQEAGHGIQGRDPLPM